MISRDRESPWQSARSIWFRSPTTLDAALLAGHSSQWLRVREGSACVDADCKRWRSPETDTAAIGDTSITNPRLTERPAKQWPPLHRTLQSVPTYKRPDRPSVLDQHHGGCRSEVAAPASFGSCPPYRCTRRSTDPYKDSSAQKTGSGWRDRPPASPHRNSDHALDLPIDESFLCGPRTAAWAACP